MNKDLTKNQIGKDKALKSIEKERKDNLEHSDRTFKYEKTENGIEFLELDLKNCIELKEPPEEQLIRIFLKGKW